MGQEEMLLSDSGSWDTDFDDEDTNSIRTSSTATTNNSEFHSCNGSSKTSEASDSTTALSDSVGLNSKSGNRYFYVKFYLLHVK